MEKNSEVEPEKEVTVHDGTVENVQVPARGNTTQDRVRGVEGSQGNNPMYSSIEEVGNPATTCVHGNLQVQAYQSVLPEPGTNDSASKGNEEKETIFPSQGPSLQSAPPKPLPYSLSKKLSKRAGDAEKLVEKVKNTGGMQA